MLLLFRYISYIVITDFYNFLFFNLFFTWYRFYNIFGMTRSLTGDWTLDLTHSQPALYH